MSAPVSTSRVTVSVLPARAASITAVAPVAVVVLASAPAAINAATTWA